MSDRIIKEKPESKVIKPPQIHVKEQKPGVVPEHIKSTEHITPTEHKLVGHKEERILSPKEYFHLNDRRKLKDLEDMYHALNNMSHHTFSHHVSFTKNDFANWVAHSLGKQELANKLFRAITKHEMLELIKNELEKK